MAKKAEGPYQSCKLAPLEQELYDFCQKHPGVVFNAPPDFQEGFNEKYLETMKTMPDYVHAVKVHYRDRLLVDLCETIETGTSLLLLVHGEEGLITAVVKFYSIQMIPDLIVNYLVYADRIDGFEKLFGGPSLLLCHIEAVATLEDSVKKMVVLDPEAKTFMEKAEKHAKKNLG